MLAGAEEIWLRVEVVVVDVGGTAAPGDPPPSSLVTVVVNVLEELVKSSSNRELLLLVVDPSAVDVVSAVLAVLVVSESPHQSQKLYQHDESDESELLPELAVAAGALTCTTEREMGGREESVCL